MTICIAEKSQHQIRDSIVVSISACHAEVPGSIPGRGVVSGALLRTLLLGCSWENASPVSSAGTMCCQIRIGMKGVPIANTVQYRCLCAKL